MAKDKLDIDFKKITLSNGRTIEQQLKYEAQRLTDILQEEIYAWWHDGQRLPAPSFVGRVVGLGRCSFQKGSLMGRTVFQKS